MQDISDRIKQIAKEAEPELISIRRELHQYPELGINLPKTHEIISRELKKIPNLKVREHMAGGYGIIAELQERKRRGRISFCVQILTHCRWKNRWTVIINPPIRGRCMHVGTTDMPPG